MSEMQEFYLYGGMSYDQERDARIDMTWPTRVSNELWYMNINHCIKDCSDHGSCYYGFCFCDVGYWGEDCSNYSCPGTACYYEELSHQQV